jgi:HSP20 family molecular chaperone IbpA
LQPRRNRINRIPAARGEAGMTVPKLIDQINRLFDEMVRDPWARSGRPALPAGQTQLDVEMPIASGQLADVSIALDGRRLTVRARRRSTAAGGGGERELVERSVILPQDAGVSAIEARFEGDVLHIRVSLRIGGR